MHAHPSGNFGTPERESELCPPKQLSKIFLPSRHCNPSPANVSLRVCVAFLKCIGASMICGSEKRKGMYPGNLTMEWASAYCCVISSIFSCSAALFAHVGVLSRRAWKMLSKVKLVTRIEGIPRACTRRHGREWASAMMAWILWSFRNLVSSICGREGSKLARECSDWSASSWYGLVWTMLGCRAYARGSVWSDEDVRM